MERELEMPKLKLLIAAPALILMGVLCFFVFSGLVENIQGIFVEGETATPVGADYPPSLPEAAPPRSGPGIEGVPGRSGPASAVDCGSILAVADSADIGIEHPCFPALVAAWLATVDSDDVAYRLEIAAVGLDCRVDLPSGPAYKPFSLRVIDVGFKVTYSQRVELVRGYVADYARAFDCR